MKNLNKFRLIGISLLLASLLLATSTLATDSDFDGLSDEDEINIYYTNPLFSDTDYDGYDDRMEILGMSIITGEQMPGYIIPPGNHPLVAAYPKIEVEVDSNYVLFQNKAITFETRTIESQEHTYGTITTKTSSTSVGTGGSHATSKQQDLINKQADIDFESSHSNTLTSDTSYYSQQDTFGKEKVTVKDAGASVTASAKFIGPVPTAGITAEAHVSYTDTTTITEGSDSFSSSGISVQVDEGGTQSSTRIYEETTKSGFGEEMTTSSSISTTTSTSVSTVDLYTIGTAQEWAEITTQDTSEWGVVRITFGLRNTGTAPATNINNLRLAIRIGDYVKTFPPLDSSGMDPNDLTPGGYVYYPGALDVPLRLEEIKAIDSGVPVEISVIDFDYDQKITTFGAYTQSTLIQIDGGVSNQDETLDNYLIPVRIGDTYLDVLKRLNYTIPVQNDPTKLIDLEIINGKFYGITGNNVTEWNWWTARSEGIENKTFLEKPAKKGSKILMTYYQDSDHDYYTDREEIHLGYDSNNANEHPKPKLIVAAYDNNSVNSPIKTLGLKIENFGDYDAYGIEARMYSPDSTTQVTDEFYGGGVRVKPKNVIIVNSTFAYEIQAQPAGEVNFALSSNNATSEMESINNGNLGDYQFEYSSPIIIELANQYQIKKSIIHVTGIPERGYISHCYKIESSINGQSWETVAPHCGVNGDGTFQPVITDEFEPTDSKYLKFTGNLCIIPQGGGVDCVDLPISELEAYGDSYAYTEPVIEVLYNDPQGPHRFITSVKINDLNTSLDTYQNSMLPLLGLSITSMGNINYYSSADILFAYLNSHANTIQNAVLHVVYNSENGSVLYSSEEHVIYPQGLFSSTGNFLPSDYGSELAGKNIAITAIATDYQGVMLAEDVQIVHIENPLRILDSTPEGRKDLNENESLDFFITAHSDGSDGLTYQWKLDSNQIAGADSTYYTYAPDFDSADEHVLSVLVFDGTFSQEMEWAVLVQNVNSAPVLGFIEDITVNENETICIIPNATDQDNDSLSFNLDSSVQFIKSNGTWCWKTGFEDAGNYTAIIKVSDGTLADSQEIRVEILDAEQEIDEDDSEEAEEPDTDEKTDSSTSSFSGGGGGTANPATVESEPTADKKTTGSQPEIMMPPTGNTNSQTTELLMKSSAPTGLGIFELRKVKVLGLLLAGLIAAFLYTVFKKASPDKDFGYTPIGESK